MHCLHAGTCGSLRCVLPQAEREGGAVLEQVLLRYPNLVSLALLQPTGHLPGASFLLARHDRRAPLRALFAPSSRPPAAAAAAAATTHATVAAVAPP